MSPADPASVSHSNNPSGNPSGNHRGTRAIQRMVEYAPSTGGLALWMHHQDVDRLPGQGAAAASDASGGSEVPWPAVARRRWGPEAEPLVAANDGNTIYYTPDFAALPLARQTAIVAHQVLHVALRHAQRQQALARLIGDVDAELFNCCADAIVNTTLSHLGWLELAPTAVRLERLLAAALEREQRADTALLEWDLERLYRAIDDRQPPQSASSQRHRRGRQPQPTATGSSRRAGAMETADAPDDAAPGSPREDGPHAAQVRALAQTQPRDLLPAATNERPESEAELAREWRERILRGHAGDGVHSLLRQLLADLPKVRTPWEQVLRTLLARGLSRRPDRSWSRPARSYIANRGRAPNGRRLPWEPGITASRAVPRLVLIVDVSGSVDDALLGRFASEIEAISRRLEARLTLIIGDDRVQTVAQYEPGRSNLRDVQFTGGGGTNFAPLLRAAEPFAPDLAVVLTDLDGPADYRPHWPVIWALTAADAHRQAPFGRILVLE